MIRPDNYLHIAGWMITDLNLKGNQLLIYATIYGFSQALEGQSYTGTLNYIAEWCNITRRGVEKALAGLLESGLIVRKESTQGGRKRIEYRVSEGFIPNIRAQQGCEQSSHDNTNSVRIETNQYEQSSHDNTNSVRTKYEPSSHNNNINNINNTINIYMSVIAYLNEKAGTSFKPTTEATRKLIRARVKDGFTLQDFKTVIDNQCRKWKGTEWQDYLRPSTLFAPSKFEGYLNARPQQASTWDEPQIPARERIKIP